MYQSGCGLEFKKVRLTKLIDSTSHMSQYFPHSFLTVMAKSVTKKIIPRHSVQRVKWVTKETTREPVTRMVKVKDHPGSRSKPTTPKHMYTSAPMDIDVHPEHDLPLPLLPPNPIVCFRATFSLCPMLFVQFPFQQSQNDYLREWLPKRSE